MGWKQKWSELKKVGGQKPDKQKPKDEHLLFDPVHQETTPIGWRRQGRKTGNNRRQQGKRAISLA